jgi:hypothetical protein
MPYIYQVIVPESLNTYILNPLEVVMLGLPVVDACAKASE